MKKPMNAGEMLQRLQDAEQKRESEILDRIRTDANRVSGHAPIDPHPVATSVQRARRATRR